MRKFIAALAFLLVTACGVSSPSASTPAKSSALEALEAAGYTHIKDEGVSLIGCDKEDSPLTSRVFMATAPNGRVGKIRVCCGLVFRGCTVRR